MNVRSAEAVDRSGKGPSNPDQGSAVRRGTPARGLLERHSYLKRAVGISREPPDQGRGVSEDLVYAEQYEWTDKDRETIRKDCEVAGVLQDVTEYRYQGEEFPEVETDIIESVRPSVYD